MNEEKLRGQSGVVTYNRYNTRNKLYVASKNNKNNNSYYPPTLIPNPVCQTSPLLSILYIQTTNISHLSSEENFKQNLWALPTLTNFVISILSTLTVHIHSLTLAWMRSVATSNS